MQAIELFDRYKFKGIWMLFCEDVKNTLSEDVYNLIKKAVSYPQPTDNLHVHHNTYRNLGHESLDDLVVLCSACHAKFHDKENSGKVKELTQSG